MSYLLNDNNLNRNGNKYRYINHVKHVDMTYQFISLLYSSSIIYHCFSYYAIDDTKRTRNISRNSNYISKKYWFSQP